MSKTRDTGFLNNVIKTDSQGNVTIVSGSTNLLSISSSGAITTTGVISGSNALSASFALTASSADNFVVRQNVTASNVLSTGNITAQTLVVQTVTSSITYSSGSNIFGNQLTNVQQFTGSLRVTGSGNHFIVGGNVGIGVSSLLSPGNTRRLLQISNGTNGAIVAMGSDTSESNNPRIFSTQYDLGLAAGVTTGTLQFYTNDTQRMLITSGGSLQVTGSAFFSTTAAFAGRVTAGGSMLLGEVQSSYSLLETTAGNGIWLRPVGIASPGGLFVNTSGNVGIGTTSPTQGKLVVSNSGPSTIYLAETSVGVNSAWTSSDGSAVFFGAISNHPLIFNTNNTERMRITGGAAAGGNLKLNGTSISSFTSNPGNVAASGTTTLVISQVAGQFQSTYLVTVVGLYTSGGVNQNGYATAIVNFFTDGSVAQANATAINGNGWSISASATTGGSFTITFTNTASTTMSNIAIRALKLNMTGGD